MKRLLFLGILPAALWAQPPQTALEALQVLPKPEAARVARIEAHDQDGPPERWHFLTYDPTAENGFREYVVAAGEIVAIREVSQFATRIGPGEVLGPEPARVDSDAVAVLAREYARALGVSVQSMNYKLCKDPQQAAPVWRVVCRGVRGDPLGELSVTAKQGEVTVPEGFGHSGPHPPDSPGDTEKRPAIESGTKRPNARVKSRASPLSASKRERKKSPAVEGSPPARKGRSGVGAVPAGTAKPSPTPAPQSTPLLRRLLQRMASSASVPPPASADAPRSKSAKTGNR
jgi:hypothetical protein